VTTIPIDTAIELDALASETHRLLSSMADQQLAPYCADWTDWAAASTRASVPPSASLPVLHWLSQAARDAPAFSRAVCARLRAASTALGWQQSYTAAEAAPAFLDRYGWCELVGPRGVRISGHLACGFLLLGPQTDYPSHRHEAEELYLPLSGTAQWCQSGGRWQSRAPGTLIHHASFEPHAMRTGAVPLLALYLWRGSGLKNHARLDR
jgi:hypothetical protein